MRRLWSVIVMSAVLVPSALAQTHVVIVSGLGGDRAHREQFHRWAITMIEAAEERLNVRPENITYLAERPEVDPERVSGKSTKESIGRTLASVADAAGPDDQVLVLLIGHGSYQGGESQISLPGPDLTAAEFATMLTRFATQRLVVVNTASASGDFIKALSGPGRTVITATKSPFERNETMFCEFFVRAFAADGADTDKNERISVLEAFNYARLEVMRAYESQKRLLTEHALLDDNGDGEGSGEPDPVNGDGAVARLLFLSGAPSEAVRTTDDPELAALYRQQRELQEKVAELRGRKAAMEPPVYERELERLLLELAQVSQSIREREGGRPR